MKKYIAMLWSLVLPLWGVVLEDRFVIDKSALVILEGGEKIYNHLVQVPFTYKGLPKQQFFGIGAQKKIATKSSSAFAFLIMPLHAQDQKVYVQVPTKYLLGDLDFRDYQSKTRQTANFILTFSPSFTHQGKTYLKLDVGDKKWQSLVFDDPAIAHFVKHKAHLLFDKPDAIDDLKVGANALHYTPNYPPKDMMLNFYLERFITKNANRLQSKNTTMTFTIALSEDEGMMTVCQEDGLRDAITIGEEVFFLGEPTTTSDIYALYVLSRQSTFNEFLKTYRKNLSLSSVLVGNTHALSVGYPTKPIKVVLDLPSYMTLDIKTAYLESFNSFEFAIDGVRFGGYIDGKSTYRISQLPCQDTHMQITNTANLNEYKKWNLQIDKSNNQLTFEPLFRIKKIEPFLYAPFLLKKGSQYVVSSSVDKQSHLEGEIKYAYIHNTSRFVDRLSVNPKTNTNIYFQYPLNASLEQILQKTKFLYNNTPLTTMQIGNDQIVFRSDDGAKTALVYAPTGNLNSFRPYFTRHFECNQDVAIEEETCFNILADTEIAIGSFLQQLTRLKSYVNVLYRKHLYQENQGENLYILTSANPYYQEAMEEEVLGEVYDRFAWDLEKALGYDLEILKGYDLGSIDLMYLSAFGKDDLEQLKQLADLGFGRIYLINFGHAITPAMRSIAGITFINHTLSRPLAKGIQDFDPSTLQEALEQIKSR